MIKATIEMKDHTLFVHKFKSLKELEQWKKLYVGHWLQVTFEEESN